MATILLIHGAYQGGWIWKPVATRLRDKGHLVFAPSLDGCGERASQLRPGITNETQAQELAGFLRFEDLHDVVVVGTSAGGMVAAKTAELARDRVARVMFADALALMHGECVRDIISSSMPVETELALGPTRDHRFDRFKLEMDEALATWAADRTTLHPIATFNEPVDLPDFWDQSWDASVVCCLQAGKPGKPHQQRAADKLGARWHELDTGHYPMLTMPDELTELILTG